MINLNCLNVTESGYGTEPDTFGGGIAISSGNVLTHDINLNAVNASCNSFVGLTLAGVHRVNITNSKFNKNIGIDNFAFGPAVWGLLLIPNGFPVAGGGFGCTNVNIVNSEANGNTSLGVAVGMESVSIPSFGFAANQNLNFLACEANNNAGGGDMSGPVNAGEGIVVAGTTNFLIEDCSAQGNKSLATAPSTVPGYYASVGFGVPFESLDGNIINCLAKNNSGIGDVSAGFRAYGSANITISHCVAQCNNNDGVGGEAWGITTDTNVGNEFAFGGPVNSNFLLDYNKAERNLAPNGLGGGIKFIAQVNSALDHNCASHNAIGLLVGDPACCQSPEPCSFYCVSENNVVAYNKVTKNSQSGILDVTPGAAVYYSNVARCNGAPGNNYVGAVFPSPVTCPSVKCCVPANLTPVRLIEDGDVCKVNTNCQRSNSVENLDIRK